MNQASKQAELSMSGRPAMAVRMFGWIMLALLAGYFVNNILIVGFGFPSLGAVFGEDIRAWTLAAVYAAFLAASAAFVLRTPNRALRRDARRISDFNEYLIRGCFFAVFFIGIADAAIAFIRVESLLPDVFGQELGQELLRSRFIGPAIHFPLAILGFVTALFSRSLGFIWLALLIVIAELLIVFSRFVFSFEQAFMADLVRYWYAALFLFSSAYTLLHEGHVRVDVLYAGLGARRQGVVNAVGAALLGMSTCWVVILIGMGSKQAILNSPVANFEVSQAGTSGMYIKYQMAAFLGVFAITMLIQFVSYMFEAVADARREPGRVDRELAAH